MNSLPQTLTLRTATAEDHAAVEHLLRRSYPTLLKPDYPPSVMVTAVPLIARANPALLTSGSYYVVECDEQIVGAGGWTRGAPGRQRGLKGQGHIRHVATDPGQARRGIGRLLLTHSIERARQAGVQELHCLSTRTAVPFYRAMGFARIRDLDIQLAPGITFPAVEMRLRLD